MAVREILLLGNPTLRKKCEPVKDFSDSAVIQTIEDLQDTLTNFKNTQGFGRGIAAPQIGISKRIVFINIDQPIVMINPKIAKQSRSTMTLWDDCFSFPDIMVRVKRAMSIEVQYLDVSGKRQNMKAAGGQSELLQHEIDHLNGVLAIDRAIDSRHIILRSEWKKMMEVEKASLQL